MLNAQPISNVLFGNTFLRPITWLEDLCVRESFVKVEDDKYEVCVNVKYFSPSELTVKIAEGFIVVEGNHEENKDQNNYALIQFKRKYAVPDDFSVNSVVFKLSSEGILTVTVPRLSSILKPDTVLAVNDQSSKVKSKL